MTSTSIPSLSNQSRHSRSYFLLLIFLIAALTLVTWLVSSLRLPSLHAQETDNQKVDNPLRAQTSPDEQVTLTEAEQKATPIQTVSARRLFLKHTIDTTGEIDLDTTRLTRVVPLTSGIVRRLYKLEGDHVRKDEPLALFASLTLGEAKLHYLQAHLEAAIARKNYQREKALFQDQHMTTQKDYLEAEEAYQQTQVALKTAIRHLQFLGLSQKEIAHISQEEGDTMLLYTLRSPMTGTLLTRNLVQGEFAETPSTAFVIADLSHLWISADVYVQDISKILMGQKAVVTVQSYPRQKTFSGTVVYIPNQVDNNSRTLKVRLEVDNREGLLKAGMFAQIHFWKVDQNKVLAVPMEAIQTINRRPVVFIREKPGTFRIQPVQTGRSNTQYTEIIRGLTEGQTIAISNLFILKSEADREFLESLGED